MMSILRRPVMDILVIGHLSRDLLITPTITRETLGGGAAYATIAPKLGVHNAGIVSKIGDDFEPEYLAYLSKSNLNLDGLVVDGPVSTRFVNTYDSQGKRTQHIEALAPPIRIDDLPDSAFAAEIIHFSPLSNNEIDPSIFRKMKRDDNLVSLDAQGFLREIKGTEVLPRHWSELPDIIQHIDIMKFDENEIRSAFTEVNEEEAVMTLIDMGVNIVLVTRAHFGSTIYSQSDRVEIPAVQPHKIIDNTGCGDVYSVSFLLEYAKTNNLKQAGLFAATCASFNLETIGPYNPPNRNAVIARMNRFL